MAYRDVRDPHTGKLLFRYDAERDLVEVVHRKKPTIIDLKQIKRQAARGKDSPAA